METNFRFGEVHNLTYHIDYSSDKVEFKEVFNTANGGVSLLGFKADQKLDTHLAPAEVMVTVLVGEIEFTMNSETRTLREGDFLLMGANVPHSVLAKADSKVMLVKIKP